MLSGVVGGSGWLVLVWGGSGSGGGSGGLWVAVVGSGGAVGGGCGGSRSGSGCGLVWDSGNGSKWGDSGWVLGVSQSGLVKPLKD